MAHAVDTASHRWPSKTAARADFKRIKDTLAVGDRVVDPIDDSKLREILERHPDYAEKVGDGIAYFFVDLTSRGDKWNVRRGAKGIWIHRTDGSDVDFSYVTCVDGHSPRSDAKEALREAVEDRRLAYRASRFSGAGPAYSDLSGAPISEPHDASVVYLDPTWEQLTFRFAESEGGWASVLVHGGGAGVQIGSSLLDPRVAKRWVEFYATYSKPALALPGEAARRKRSDETAWMP
ncbi:DCL family protein [Curtobacterium flaccumfaciens]|uniref:DCL family protein n=1 Tax=Curtobacterium flaccumfaciens TaxID=2035 RepID=UPI00399355F7